MSQKSKLTIVSVVSFLVGVSLTLFAVSLIQEDTTIDTSDEAPQTQEISGFIVAIEPDCEEPRYLNRDDMIGVEESPILCDSGSFIELDGGERVQTALTFSSDPFDKHDSGWELGQEVSLTVTESGSPDYYSLDCDSCGQN